MGPDETKRGGTRQEVGEEVKEGDRDVEKEDAMQKIRENVSIYSTQTFQFSVEPLAWQA